MFYYDFHFSDICTISSAIWASTGESEEIAAPSNLATEAISTSKIRLSWDDNSNNETGIKIERKKAGGSYTQIATVEANTTSYTATGLSDNTKYYFRVRAYNTTGNSSYSNEAYATTVEQTVISLVIGKSSYYVNSKLKTMDTEPIIKDGRTLLPIRYVAEDIGAKVEWNEYERKVTIAMKGNKIELWLGNNVAKVNDEYKLVDTQNPYVSPSIVPPGRTMLPLRFVAENLGCQVDWNSNKKEVTVTYLAS